MRRIKATAGRVVLTTCALAGVGIGVAMPASAVPDNGTLSVSPTTFAVNETATATADNCPNGVIELILNGGSVAQVYTDADGTHSISLVGADLGVGPGNVSGVCFDVTVDDLDEQIWTPRFVYSNVSFTVTEVVATTQAPVTTVAAPVTTVADPAPTETTAAPAGATPTTAPAGVTATTAAAVAAAGPAVAAAGASAQSLPATGQGSEHAAAVAVALLAIGVGALLLGRRRPAV